LSRRQFRIRNRWIHGRRVILLDRWRPGHERAFDVEGRHLHRCGDLDEHHRRIAAGLRLL
jgi:hypothetical protein